MVATVETISSLERRITVTVPLKPIQEEVSQRISRLSRTVKLSGFRPGKVPLKLVEQQFGPQVRDEVLSSTVERTFGEAVEENKLRVAGFPDIEHKPFSETAEQFEYTATFEVFPEVQIGDLSKVKIERPALEVAEADVKRTIDVLLRQRATYEAVKRAAKKGDKVTVALTASVDGQEVESTGEEGIQLVLGEGGRVPEFDDSIIGSKAGSDKTFEITYPADHKPEQLAGKTVSYNVIIKNVEQAILPELNADFARGLGVEDGDVEKMQAEIKQSLVQEVDKRIRAKLKEQVFQALIENVTVDLPKAIINAEINRLMGATQKDLEQRGVDLSNVTLEPSMFEDQAKRHASLRLILSEVVVKNELQANADQVRAMVNQFAQSFERPEDVVRWYYDDSKRLDEPAALATEENVVSWVLAAAKVADKKVKFEELMGNS
ncbi:trigger factor [Methylovorus sp. MM2]|uniref:trigger factor n=1 Tax=Methylovorus sp. MM2 TaxID=1848038 RepID=UPI0007DF6188|nr:trigger factor [Methylovorus sp. MM2]OAM52943.1 trigger factor [Methylovorus sp. MM2]